MTTEFHKVSSCNKCKGTNTIYNEVYESAHLHEASTKCEDCGFDDYWAYGFFESGAEMASNCETYSVVA